jgi:hypothetical protein
MLSRSSPAYFDLDADAEMAAVFAIAIDFNPPVTV